MELFEEIRRGYAAGETIQGLAKKHEVHRRMVRQAIAGAIPPERKKVDREHPALLRRQIQELATISVELQLERQLDLVLLLATILGQREIRRFDRAVHLIDDFPNSLPSLHPMPDLKKCTSGSQN